MAFAIRGYQDNLKKQIEDYSSILNNTRSMSPAQIGNTGGIQGSAFGGTGLSLSSLQRTQMQKSIFNVSEPGQDVAKASQNNNTQNTMSASTSSFLEAATQIKNNAISALTTAINSLQSQLNSLNADTSALASPQTSGQSSKPEENMPLDNQGTDNKAGNTKDSQRPQVGFGEETVEDKSKTEETKEKEEAKNPEKAEREESTQQAQTSTELDKAAQKETDKKAEEAKLKLQQEAAKQREETAQA